MIAVFVFSAALLQQGAAESAFVQAAAALRDGRLVEAERGFRRVLQLEPSNTGALGNLGVTYARMERYAEAVDAYRRALKLAPSNPGLKLNLAIAYVKQEDYGSARPLLSNLPSTTQTQELLATCELFLGDPKGALTRLVPLPHSPEVLYLLGTAHLRLKQIEPAKAAFAELLSTAAPAQAHLLLGRAYADNTLFEEAVPELRSAVEADPSSVPARLELAKAYISLRDNENAEKDLRAVLRIRPEQPDAAYYLGALLIQMSREDEGIPFLELARKARPAAWGAYYYLGRAWMQKNQPATALPFLEKASRINPDEAAAWYQLARAYRALERPADAKRARERYGELNRRSLSKAEEAVVPNR